jgi:hypothetical protein
MFLRTRVKLLGYIVSRKGLSASPDHVTKVNDFVTVKDMQSFLGLTRYYPGYIRNYTQRKLAVCTSIEVCRAANRTLLGGAWTADCDRKHLDIIAALQSAVHGPLADDNFDRAFRLCVDVCMTPVGLGVSLEQVEEDGSIRLVGYASRVLTKTQTKSCTSRKESLVLVFGLRTFKWCSAPTLHITLVTGHFALKFVRDSKREVTPGHPQMMQYALEKRRYA